jgi:hypothetical protein
VSAPFNHFWCREFFSRENPNNGHLEIISSEYRLEIIAHRWVNEDTRGTLYAKLQSKTHKHIMVLWIVTPYSDVVECNIFGRLCCLHLQGEVCILLHNHTTSQLRRPRLESSSLSEPQISHLEFTYKCFAHAHFAHFHSLWLSCLFTAHTNLLFRR